MRRYVLAALLALAPQALLAQTSITKAAGGGAAVTGNNTWTGTQTFAVDSAWLDDAAIVFGTGSDAGIEYDTAITPDSLFIGVGQDSRCAHFGEWADRNFDWAMAQQTHPCFVIHSAAQGTTQWLRFAHNGTDAVLDTGAGAVSLPGTAANTVRVGAGAIASVASATVVGAGAYSDQNTSSSVFGYSAQGRGDASLAIGALSSTTSGHDGSMAFGYGATTTAANQLVMGSNGYPISTIFWGKGVTNASATAWVASGTGGSGVDNAGGSSRIRGGLSTGNRVPATTGFSGGAATVTSGTTAQTEIDRYIPNAFKVLTNNSATNLLSCVLAATTTTNGIIRYGIEVSDGTDIQSEVGFVTWTGTNKAAAFDNAVAEVNSAQKATSGTLTTTWAITGANPAVITLNANSSLTPSTGYPRITFAIENFAQQACTVQ